MVSLQHKLIPAGLRGWGQGCSSGGGRLAWLCQMPWVQSPPPHLTCVVALVCNASTRDIEAGGSEIPGHLQLHSKFKTSLGYKDSSLEKEFLPILGTISLSYRRPCPASTWGLLSCLIVSC